MLHLKRAGILLVGVLLVVFVGLRAIPAPGNLLKFGFHPKEPEKNTQLWASQPMEYASTSLCRDCHQKQYDTVTVADHKTVSCENCHGPAKSHIETGVALPIDTSRELCGTCHARLTSRPDSFPQVDLSEHGGQASCITCHQPHDPRAGMAPQVPHDLEGRSDCQVCHNTSSIKPFPQDHLQRTADTCLQCHKTSGGTK